MSTRNSPLTQGPAVVWLTGLPGAGKSTLAEALASALRARGENVAVVDGDVLRQGLCSDLGFSEADRNENVRRAAELAHVLASHGLRVVVALISPLRTQRASAAQRLSALGFAEVHVDAPLSVTEQRDPKGLYAKARRGELRGLTGIDAPYESPLSPALRIDTSQCSVADAVQRLLDLAGSRS